MGQKHEDEMINRYTKNQTLVIAEAGVNHNGDMKLAYQLIDAATAAGADFVKFQTFRTENLVTMQAEKAAYQKEATGANETQFAMLKKLELTEENHHDLINYCAGKHIGFLSTPFDVESVTLLAKLNIPLLKIPSGEITNLPLLRQIGSLRKDVLLSTGMSTLEEIEAALAVLENAGTARKNICVLHCTTQYPTPVKEVNLRAMLTIKQNLNVEIGYSDHTLGTEVPIAAVALGARVIEKHFTLNRNLPGPDHKASLEPAELGAMVAAIRNIELALGNGEKLPSESERQNLVAARKSIHTQTALPAGHKISEENLIMKRPGNGISPMQLETVIGKKTRYGLAADHMLTYLDLAE